jgi:hypothetical protein
MREQFKSKNSKFKMKEENGVPLMRGVASVITCMSGTGHT